MFVSEDLIYETYLGWRMRVIEGLGSLSLDALVPGPSLQLLEKTFGLLDEACVCRFKQLEVF